MEIKKWVLMAVSVITAAVVFGACLPVFADTTQADDTFTNEGYYNMEKVDNSTNKTISWTGANPNIIVIDNENLDLTGLIGNYTIFGSDSVIVRWSNGAMRWYSDDTSGGTTSTDTLTVVIDSGNVSITKNGATTSTVIGNNAWIASVGNSDYVAVMKNANKPAYVNGDSEVYLIGVSVGASIDRTICVFANGNINDGLDIQPLYIGGEFSNVVFTDETVTYTENTNYEDLYLLDKYEFSVSYTQGGVDKSADLTYNYFIVPSEVTAERSVHPEGASKILMDLLPVIIGGGLLLGVVAVVIRRRM